MTQRFSDRPQAPRREKRAPAPVRRWANALEIAEMTRRFEGWPPVEVDGDGLVVLVRGEYALLTDNEEEGVVVYHLLTLALSEEEGEWQVGEAFVPPYREGWLVYSDDPEDFLRVAAALHGATQEISSLKGELTRRDEAAAAARRQVEEGNLLAGDTLRRGWANAPARQYRRRRTG